MVAQTRILLLKEKQESVKAAEKKKKNESNINERQIKEQYNIKAEESLLSNFALTF